MYICISEREEIVTDVLKLPYVDEVGTGVHNDVLALVAENSTGIIILSLSFSSGSLFS